MARIVKEARLQERSARARLPVRHHPYWRSICEGRHVGYYRGPRGGRWIARYREAGSTEPYVSLSLGDADDRGEADGDAILNWKQALDKATIWFDRRVKGEIAADPNLTVRSAVMSYVAMRDARKRTERTKGSFGRR